VLWSGIKQREFARLLAAHGFDWGTYEADHIRDLRWAGADAYNNLWALAGVHNNAANDVLNQPINYTDAVGVAHIGVPLHTTPFRLRPAARNRFGAEECLDRLPNKIQADDIAEPSVAVR
jgi:hypothetical protein